MNQPPLNPDAKRKCVDMLLAYSGTPRDRLYEYPHRSDDSDRYISNAESLLDQILAAALPEVTSVEELEALPAKTVILDSHGDVSVITETGLFMCDDGDCYELDEVADDLPARVLYRPEVNDA